MKKFIACVVSMVLLFSFPGVVLASDFGIMPLYFTDLDLVVDDNGSILSPTSSSVSYYYSDWSVDSSNSPVSFRLGIGREVSISAGSYVSVDCSGFSFRSPSGPYSDLDSSYLGFSSDPSSPYVKADYPNLFLYVNDGFVIFPDFLSGLDSSASVSFFAPVDISFIGLGCVFGPYSSDSLVHYSARITCLSRYSFNLSYREVPTSYGAWSYVDQNDGSYLMSGSYVSGGSVSSGGIGSGMDEDSAYWSDLASWSLSVPSSSVDSFRSARLSNAPSSTSLSVNRTFSDPVYDLTGSFSFGTRTQYRQVASNVISSGIETVYGSLVPDSVSIVYRLTDGTFEVVPVTGSSVFLDNLISYPVSYHTDVGVSSMDIFFDFAPSPYIVDWYSVKFSNGSSSSGTYSYQFGFKPNIQTTYTLPDYDLSAGIQSLLAAINSVSVDIRSLNTTVTNGFNSVIAKLDNLSVNIPGFSSMVTVINNMASDLAEITDVIADPTDKAINDAMQENKQTFADNFLPGGSDTGNGNGTSAAVTPDQIEKAGELSQNLQEMFGAGGNVDDAFSWLDTPGIFDWFTKETQDSLNGSGLSTILTFDDRSEWEKLYEELQAQADEDGFVHSRW